MMQLFGSWQSLATYRVRIVLNLKGILVPETMIDLVRGEQHEPKFRKLNPMGAVPALILEDGTAVTQSLAIMEYLEEVETVPPLLPRDPAERARARALCAITAADAHPLVTPRVQAYLNERGWQVPERRAWARHWFTTGLEAYEAQVGPGPFCCGPEPGLADACLASHAAGAQYFDADITPFPAVKHILDACMERPEFARAHPQRQPGAPGA